MPNFIGRLFGDPNERERRKLQPTVERINRLESQFQTLSDTELRATTDELKRRLEGGATLDQMLPDAFAAVREATRRTLNKRHYDVQIVAGIVLHQGRIAEMKTGEGKTQVAALPLYLNALEGKGCHLVTPNDYLARLGGGWIGPIYHLLGVSVAVIYQEAAAIYDPDFEDPSPHGDDRLNHWRPCARRDAYLADITYGLNSEFGFDYLRDNMQVSLEGKVQRPLHYAIVDEVDNILIDEARTPLIISAPAEESADVYYQLAKVLRQLRPDEDFTIEDRTQAVTFTDDGVNKVEHLLGVENLYDERNFWLARTADAALKALVLKRRDRDYVVRNGEIVIVDEFTGRMMPGRRWSEGLHQAIEAKEGLAVQRENRTWATITLQNYFRMYHKLAGMTGTAATESEEFSRIYNLDVITIPTHRPMVRQDATDLVFKTEDAKFNAVVGEIEQLHAQSRPVLVGTVSIEKSEQLSRLLQAKGIAHQVLNAKFHEQEAAIIADAGQPSATTIATNMAGRGTDIVLGPGVTEVGGLHIIGTERHESRRIDNQLRGRAGRQGDPGSSRFYVSLEDELMRRFGSDRIAGIMNWLKMPEDEAIEHSTVTRAIESAQSKVEGYNFDIRKHILEYDNVMNEQRTFIYADRDKVLRGENLRDHVVSLVDAHINQLVEKRLHGTYAEEWDLEGLIDELGHVFPLPATLTVQELARHSRENVNELLITVAHDEYRRTEERVGEALMREVERRVMLWSVDTLWVDHLTTIDDLREGIGLRAFGQRDPLVEYKREAHDHWERLVAAINSQVVHTIYHLEVTVPAPQQPTELRTNRDATPATTTRPRPTASRSPAKVGRNDLCPCGSGKKYKYCHGAGAEAGPVATMANGMATNRSATPRSPVASGAARSAAQGARPEGRARPAETTRRSGASRRRSS